MARKKDSGPRCVWTDTDDAALIRKLRDCKDIGMQSESGWKPQVWHLCAEALKGGAGGFKTAEKIVDRIFRCLSRLLHLMAARHASRCLRAIRHVIAPLLRAIMEIQAQRHEKTPRRMVFTSIYCVTDV